MMKRGVGVLGWVLAGALLLGCTTPGPPGVILIHAGYGTGDGFVLQGRVLEDPGIQEPDADRGSIDNMIETVKTMETDELVGVRVRVEVASMRFEATTDDDGVWRVEAEELEKPLRVGAAPVKVELIDDHDHPTPPAMGRLHVLPRGGVAVISDFDDTVVNSEVTSKTKLVYRTLTRNAAQLEPIPGVSEAYNAAVKAGAAGFFYVSGSPQNLHERIAAFLALEALPVGPILLKNFGSDPLTEQIDYKVGQITAILTRVPHLEFVLVGDSGEKDPEIYRLVAEQNPDRIAGIIIRRVPDADNTSKRFAGMTTVDDYAGAPTVVADMVKKALGK